MGRLYAVSDVNAFVFDVGTNAGIGTGISNSVSVDYLWQQASTNGIVGGANVTVVDIQNADMEASGTIDIVDPSNNLRGIINCLSPSAHTCSVSGATNVQVNQLYLQRNAATLPSSTQLIYSPSAALVNTPGIYYFASGTTGANSNCLTSLGSGGTSTASYFCNIAGSQVAFTLNTYFNGTNWVNVTGFEPASAFRLLSNQAGTGGAYQLSVCPDLTAGATLAMDTTCVAQWTHYSASGNQTWFNSQAGSLIFGSNIALAANPSANWTVDFSGNEKANTVLTTACTRLRCLCRGCRIRST